MDFVEGSLRSVLNNQYASHIVTLFLTVYAVKVAPEMPEWMAGVLSNDIIRLFMMALLLFVRGRDLQTALMGGAMFMAFMVVVGNQNVVNTVNSVLGFPLGLVGKGLAIGDKALEGGLNVVGKVADATSDVVDNVYEMGSDVAEETIGSITGHLPGLNVFTEGVEAVSEDESNASGVNGDKEGFYPLSGRNYSKL